MPRHKLLCLALISFASHAFAADPAGAVMYRGNASHRANYEATPIESPKGVKWKTALDGEVFSSPVVANGLAYIGSGNNRFYALNAETGKIAWQFATHGAVHSSPAVSRGLVYFGDFAGYFYALDAASGALRWEHHVIGERQFGAKGIHWAPRREKYYVDVFDFFLSSPVIGNDTLYYASGNGAVFALDPATGKQKWSFITNEVIHCAPALADGKLYVGGWDTFFYCLDAATGAVQWKIQTGDDPVQHNQMGIQSAPVVAGDTVYFGCRDAHMYAIDTTDGKVRWKKSHGASWMIASPVIVGDTLYYNTSDSKQFFAVDKATGTTRFEFPTRCWGFSSPIAVGDIVYFGTFAGDLNALDTKTGKLKWTWQTDAARSDPLHLLGPDGSLDMTAKVFADFDGEDWVGALHRMFSTGAILSTPFAYKDSLIFGTADGFVYSIH